MDTKKGRAGQIARADARVIVVATIASMLAIVFVGYWASSQLGSEGTAWKPTGPAPRNAAIEEYPGPEHCGWQDQTYLNIYRLGWYVRDDADVTLPEGVSDTGWRSGSRQLWIGSAFIPTMFDRGAPWPDAVYIVSPDGVERWPRQTVFCF